MRRISAASYSLGRGGVDGNRCHEQVPSTAATTASRTNWEVLDPRSASDRKEWKFSRNAVAPRRCGDANIVGSRRNIHRIRIAAVVPGIEWSEYAIAVGDFPADVKATSRLIDDRAVKREGAGTCNRSGRAAQSGDADSASWRRGWGGGGPGFTVTRTLSPTSCVRVPSRALLSNVEVNLTNSDTWPGPIPVIVTLVPVVGVTFATIPLPSHDFEATDAASVDGLPICRSNRTSATDAGASAPRSRFNVIGEITALVIIRRGQKSVVLIVVSPCAA